MRYRQLASHLQNAAPLETDVAEQVLLATLQELASLLPGGSARAFAAALDVPLTRRDESPTSGGVEALWSAVAHALSVTELRAREYVQLVLAVLAQDLGETSLNKLRRELPEDVAALLRVDASHVTETPRPPVRHGRSMADGRPGGQHPLSMAAPGSTHPVSDAVPPTSQQNSVSDLNPHADTKMSSASGLTQERERESLASGRTSKS